MEPVKILIVDDKQGNIISLEAMLKRDDIEIHTTCSPNEALKLAWELDISIALIDVQMPEMDGFELVEILKSNPRTKDILVLFVTAISKDVKYVVKGLGAGAVDYLYKPLDSNITIAKVDTFIQLARHQIEIKNKNKELQNFELVVNNSADIICSVNADNFHIQNINPSIEKILGYSQESVIGKSIIDFAIEEHKPGFIKKLEEIVRNKSAYALFEFQFAMRSKRTIWAECRVTYQNGTIFLNINNISLQKSYLNQLIKSKEQAEQIKKTKETFLANMSHELRTPVNGIIGLTALLRETLLDDQQKSMIDMIDISSQSLLGVLNDILDLSKIEAGKFSITRSSNNIHDILTSVFGLLKYKADEKNIKFLLEIDPAVPAYLMIDPLRLNQILMNLLSNAIKFTERGFVKLNASVLQIHGQRVKMKFSVEDTGIGIAKEKLGKIFESFEQAEVQTGAKYGGTGLGLTIVKKLAELKGGEITLDSRVGNGSVFSFISWFDISSKPIEKDLAAEGLKISNFKNIRILVAEDNRINQFIISKMLKNNNIEVEIVNDGRKVIEKLQIDNYDLILMDTHMPEMNGYDAAKAIRANFSEPKRSIPIISLSAATLEHEQHEALLAGMNDVLSKPFKPEDLMKKILKLLSANKLIP
jgi:PAS domain S-box-containing protein